MHNDGNYLLSDQLHKLIDSTNALEHHQIRAYDHNHDTFENAFVINLTDRPQRLAKTKDTLRQVGLSAVRFSAIRGSDLTKSTVAEMFNHLRPAELGCVLSHLCILSLAAKHANQDGFTLIFEDDIVSSSGADYMKHAFYELKQLDANDPIDLIYFGKCLERCGAMVQIKDNLYRAVEPSCCHAYAIKNSFAKRLIHDLDGCHRHRKSLLNGDFFNCNIDGILRGYQVHGLAKGVVFHPAIFYQDVISTKSDLRDDTSANYKECHDDPHGLKIRKEDVQWARDDAARQCRIRYRIVLIIVIVIIVLVVLGVWQRRKVMPLLRKRSVQWGTLGVVAFVALIILTVMLAVSSRADRERWMKAHWFRQNFGLKHRSILVTAMSCCSHQPVTINCDKHLLTNLDYKVFNPNGVFARVHYDNRLYDPMADKYLDVSREGVFITTSRASNGRVSYPILQVFSSDFGTLLEAKRINIESHRSMKSNELLGYEDMRIFQHRNVNGRLLESGHHNYLIGVNLDRHHDQLPSMILVKLDCDFNSVETWHLKYEPCLKAPQKNWSPLTLPGGDLGFIVDIDPLVVVKRKSKYQSELREFQSLVPLDSHGSPTDALDDDYSEHCELVYSSKCQTKVEKMRNSTVCIDWHSVPREFQEVFGTQCGQLDHVNYQRYVLLGHTKFVESDFVPGGRLVTYQHYFVLVDLPKSIHYQNRGLSCKVTLSKPFNVETCQLPHIEYVSGLSFARMVGRDLMVIMYGLRDCESKYLTMTSGELMALLN